MASNDPSFEGFVSSLRPALMRLAVRLCDGDVDEAEDVVQTATERALKRRALYREGTNLRGWVFRILYNAFLDLCRHKRVTEHAMKGDSLAFGEGCCSPPDGFEAGDGKWWLELSRDEIDAAAEQLDADLRRVFVLFENLGWSYADIARELAIPSSTVGTLLRRARIRLRLLLAERHGP